MGTACLCVPTSTPPPVNTPQKPRDIIQQKCIVLGAGTGTGKTTCIKHLASSDWMDRMRDSAPTLEGRYRILLEYLIKLDHTSNALPPSSLEEMKRSEVLSRLQQLWKEHESRWPLPVGADRSEALFPPIYPFEAAKYLMDRAVARLGDPPEPVSLQDILNKGIRTMGIVEHRLQMTCSDGEVLEGNVYDVGGMRNERKKWIHLYDDVTLIIFTVDLGGYCHTLYEDDHTCSLVEQLAVFEQISTARWFPDTLMCLVFNHLDRFLRLAAFKPFNRALFPDAPELGPGKEWEGVEYIKQLFLKKWVPHPPHQAVPFMVTTSLVHEHPVFIHQETHDRVVVLTHLLPTCFPAVLCSLVGEYASGSDTLISPGMADAARRLALHLLAKSNTS